MNPAVEAYVGIGANLGNAVQSVEQAILAISALPHTRCCARSSLFCSAPVDAQGNDFINAVVRIDTGLDAEELLRQLQAIEHAFGRERPFLNAPRTLDLDLLLIGQTKMLSDILELPHPRMTQRAFVLKPLLEIDADITIPGMGPAASYLPGVASQIITQLPDTRAS